MDTLIIDQLADNFAKEFAEQISPIVGYIRKIYGNTTSFDRLPVAHRIFILRMVNESTTHSVYPTDFTRRRAASQAMDMALRVLKGEGIDADDRAHAAALIGNLAATIAQTYGE